MVGKKGKWKEKSREIIPVNVHANKISFPKLRKWTSNKMYTVGRAVNHWEKERESKPSHQLKEGQKQRQ